jgi:hypothetical protein
MKKIVYLMAIALISVFAVSCGPTAIEADQVIADSIETAIVDTVQPLAPDTTVKPVMCPEKK